MTSWGGFGAPVELSMRRNSAYESMTVGMPFAGSKRATWMMYLPACGEKDCHQVAVFSHLREGHSNSGMLCA
jgi:hypothetical protein